MARYYLESILVFGMLYIAWQVWKLWMPNESSEDETEQSEDTDSENRTAESLFDAISRWGLGSPPDSDDTQAETPKEPSDSSGPSQEDD